MIFNVVETNLMCIYNTGSRLGLIKSIEGSLPDVYNGELREVMEQVISKLDKLTDEEFSRIALYPDYDDDTEGQEE